MSVKKVIVGQDHLLERAIVALLARGKHILVEGARVKEDDGDQDFRRGYRWRVQTHPVLRPILSLPI
ncbi:MAG: hypothetical protein U0X92_15780 [Anaerolineales bacterium]